MKSTFLLFFFCFEVSTRPGTRTSSSTCTCQSWRCFASSSKTTTPRRTTSLWPSTRSRSAACKWVSPSAGVGGAQTRLCLHASEKGVCWNRRPASASAQRLLRLLHFSTLLCSHAGYRHVPLLDKNGNLLPSAGLFVHIMVLDAE